MRSHSGFQSRIRPSDPVRKTAAPERISTNFETLGGPGPGDIGEITDMR
jgi:hypothetical protein